MTSYSGCKDVFDFEMRMKFDKNGITLGWLLSVVDYFKCKLKILNIVYAQLIGTGHMWFNSK